MHYRLRALWYLARYDIRTWGPQKTLLPHTGRGRYVDVFVNGPYIDIVNHGEAVPKGTIRLIPYQPNHGIMVEYFNPEGKMRWRVHADYTKFLEMGFSQSEVGPKKLEPEIKVESKKIT